MAESIRSYVISSVLVSLFVVSMILGSFYLSQSVGQESPLILDPSINDTLQNLTANLESVKGTADTQKESLLQKIPVVGDVLFSEPVLGAARSFSNIGTVFYDVLTTFFTKSGIVGTLVISVSAGLLALLVGLAFWRFIKTGT